VSKLFQFHGAAKPMVLLRAAIIAFLNIVEDEALYIRWTKSHRGKNTGGKVDHKDMGTQRT
jgi:hypothetical protein